SKTLEELSQEFGISRERVRQIESKAFDKIKGFINRAN
ncbi:MAG: sigma factor-like helix-turn-helix DNA-binding protein, partial [Hyphomicrobiales bacterium]